MLHIRPIPEEQANTRVQEIFQDIKKTLQVSIVPLLFQYIANYEEYFAYSWEKIKINIQSDYFDDAYKQLIGWGQKAVREIYTPSTELQTFIIKLHEVEKEGLFDTVKKLQALNAKLLLITIGMREGVKGVVVEHQALPKLGQTEVYQEIFETFTNIVQESQSKSAAASTRMLAPLFGSSALAFSHYADFFALVASDVDTIMMREEYLTKRVLLEQESMQKASGFRHPLGCTYAEITRFAAGKQHFVELLYILSETFPTQFPRLLLTSSMMEKALQGDSTALAKQN